jgi:hypothetical protein
MPPLCTVNECAIIFSGMLQALFFYKMKVQEYNTITYITKLYSNTTPFICINECAHHKKYHSFKKHLALLFCIVRNLNEPTKPSYISYINQFSSFSLVINLHADCSWVTSSNMTIHVTRLVYCSSRTRHYENLLELYVEETKDVKNSLCCLSTKSVTVY